MIRSTTEPVTPSDFTPSAVTTPSAATPTAPAPAAGARVPVLRRAAVVGTGLLACLLPVSFGLSAAGMLVTGVEADHRFHQVTGQGVLLSALWLGALLPLVVAGLRGRRPSTSTALHHLAVVAAALVAGALAPGVGGALVAGYAAVTGALVWSALPVRPRLRGAFTRGLDLALVPLALLTAALVTPFALSEVDLQNALVDEHAEMAHYFDMAWVVLALLGLAVAAALAPAARALSVWASTGLLVTGAARYLLTDEVTWSASAVALGAAGLALVAARASSPRTAA